MKKTDVIALAALSMAACSQSDASGVTLRNDRD